jgi:hypothetical protein
MQQMQEQLVEVISIVQEKKIGDALDKIYKLLKIAKEIHDC